jgi:hypothetical protein
MPRILKIDQFVKDFPSMYGLNADGTSYNIQHDITIEALLSYTESESAEYGKCLEAVWSKIVANKGGIIMASKNGVFFKPIDYEGFIECRPVSDTKIGEPQMLRFKNGDLKEIGKGLINCHPMSFEDMDEIIKQKI